MVTVLPLNCGLLYSHSLKIAAEYAGDLEGYYWYATVLNKWFYN